MKEIFYNPDQLEKKDIDEVVFRAKALMIDKDDNILLGYAYGTYQFPGGHVKDQESLVDCLIREIKEETGIVLTEELKPFIKLTYYNKNYRNTGKNRENTIFYYLVNTDEKPVLEKQQLDEAERLGNYQIIKLPLATVKETLLKTVNANPINRTIVEEMLAVLSVYQQTRNV